MDDREEEEEDVRKAMRRVSMAAIPSPLSLNQEDESSIVSPLVSERLKSMLTRIRETREERGCFLGNDDDTVAVKERITAFNTLSCVPPFSYLPESERRKLVLDLTMLNYENGDIIIQQESETKDVFVLYQGRVMLVILKHNQHPSLQHSATDSPSFKFLGYLDAPAVVGEYEAVFETPRNAQVVAGGSVKAYRMSGERFLSLLSYRAFEVKMALGMRNRGLFKDIDSFVSLVKREALSSKEWNFQAMLASYREMLPAIHSKLHSSSLDIEGWTYALRRLPDTVTSTYVYLLSNSVPMPFMHESFDLNEILVPSVARRRLAFHVHNGKLLVIMREKFSDVLDFLSLLCCHVHECNKLRLKLNQPGVFDVIHGCLWSPQQRLDNNVNVNGLRGSISTTAPSSNNMKVYRRQVYEAVSVQDQAAALAQLPLNSEEIRGLQTLWPNDVLYRVWDIIAMHENIQVHGDFSASYVEASDRWAEHIRQAVVELLRKRNGNADNEICVSTDLTTHIISSNTTSVRNLLSPYIHRNADAIHKWGMEVHPEIEDAHDLSETDKLYALCTAYLKAHPGARQEQDKVDACCITTLRHTELTGIQVELIDLDALCEYCKENGVKTDSYLAPFVDTSSNHDINDNEKKRRRLLVNIDYAFGKQAEQLISSLCLLFGESVASVGVMGKAGGLQGKRGDIVVADYLIHQDGDEMTLIDNTGVDRDALARLSGRMVWSGGVLTVLGTLLQDHRLLQYYKKLMGCVSLEMEGSYYAREIMRLKKAQLLAEDVHMRFLYYFSDTPLHATETLSKDLALSEVIPPQYAVTRELLRLVLADER